MTTKVVVRQGGFSAAEVDYANAFTGRKGTPFFEGNTPLLNFAHRFANGEAAQGQFKFVDPDGELTSTNLTLRPWAEVKLTEDASGDELILGWMRLVTGDVQRRSVYIGGYDIDHNPQMMDINLDVRGIPFSGPWSRPAETDYERLQALQARKLNGSSSTGRHRDSTTITVDSFANGHLVEHDTPVDLDAKVYPEGTEVSEVIADIAEQAGKEWAIVPHHKDGATHKCLLYMDQEDLDRYQSIVRISDQYADWDPDDETSPTFEPHWMQGAGRESDFQTVASGVVSIWSGTNDEPQVVTVENDEAETDAEVWWTVFNDGDSTTEAQATRRATWEMKDRRRPQDSMKPSILVKASQAHLVGAGMAIQTKSVVMNSGPDKGSWVWRRVAECRVEPAANGLHWLHLNLERPRFSGKSGGAGQPKSTSPKPAPECVEQEPDTETILSDSRDGDWGATSTTDPCWGGDPYKVASGAGFSGPNTAGIAVTAGTTIRGTVNFRNETGDDSWENVDSYNYDVDLVFEDSGASLPPKRYQIIDERFHNQGCIDVTRSTTQVVPTGYDRARIRFNSRLGGYKAAGWISEVTFADPVENDPFCLPSPTGDSPFYARSDDPRFDADDQHIITKLQQRVVNNSAIALTIGDVVIPDITYDGAAVTTTTTAALTDAMVGIVTGDMAVGETGIVMWSGKFEQPLNDGASTSADGDYLYTSTTAGAAGVSATRDEGAVGRVIRDASGDPVYTLWWGVPDTAGAVPDPGTIDHGDLTGLADDDHPQYVRTTDGGKEVISVVSAAGSTETLDLADGNVHDVTLTADCTLTLTGATNGLACHMDVLLRQGSGAPWDVTWPGSVVWVGGAAPVLETAEDTWNWVSLVTMDGGTTWFADGGAATGSISAGGHYEVAMVPDISDPPEPVQSVDGTDWVYGWVSD